MNTNIKKKKYIYTYVNTQELKGPSPKNLVFADQPEDVFNDLSQSERVSLEGEGQVVNNREKYTVSRKKVLIYNDKQWK